MVDPRPYRPPTRGVLLPLSLSRTPPGNLLGRQRFGLDEHTTQDREGRAQREELDSEGDGLAEDITIDLELHWLSPLREHRAELGRRTDRNESDITNTGTVRFGTRRELGADVGRRLQRLFDS